MNHAARLLRSLSKLRFRLLGHATVKDIPTAQFNDIVEALCGQGWVRRSEYDGVDAWIDYGRIVLAKGSTTLLLEWDNWTEGSIEGPRSIIEQIAAEHEFEVSDEWRWSEYDEQPP